MLPPSIVGRDYLIYSKIGLPQIYEGSSGFYRVLGDFAQTFSGSSAKNCVTCYVLEAAAALDMLTNPGYWRRDTLENEMAKDA